MKRRVLIAKALAHEPRLLFLDEPTAGVDVELRKDMWDVVRELKSNGVTIILTTHYIEEAEAIADRVGVIADGQILLVKDKDELMAQLGKKQLCVHLNAPIPAIPASLASYDLELNEGGSALIYTYDTKAERTGITALLNDVAAAGLLLADVSTRQSSLEDIFVGSRFRREVMNWTAIWSIYQFEMARFFRTLFQSFLSPVLSTSLYFVVFGAAIGSRIDQVDGINYGAFIVPGLIMLSVMTQSISNASFGIYFPKFIGTIYELLSAPVSFLEIVLGYVGAAATKALFIGVVILATSTLFVDITIAHPLAMVLFLVLTCLSFALMRLSSASGPRTLSSCNWCRC